MQRKYRVILGSQSPRRQELLRGLGIDFEVKTIDGQEELFPHDLPVEQILQYLAVQKAEALGEFIDDDTLLITADTIVTLDGGVFGKPKDRAEAYAMLRALSAATHEVITGVCVTTAARREVFATSTRVTFGCLTDDEIYYYIDKYRPFDKAEVHQRPLETGVRHDRDGVARTQTAGDESCGHLTHLGAEGGRAHVAPAAAQGGLTGKEGAAGVAAHALRQGPGGGHTGNLTDRKSVV